MVVNTYGDGAYSDLVSILITKRAENLIYEILSGKMNKLGDPNFKN